MNRWPLVAVSGWAHGAESFEGLIGRLRLPFGCARFDLARLAAAAEGAAETERESRYAGGLVGILQRADAPVVLMGWSTGGLAVLEAALRCPDRVRGLILLAGCARYCDGDDYPCGVPEKNLRALMLEMRRRPEVTVQGFLRECAHPVVPSHRSLEDATQAALQAGPGELAAGLAYLRHCDLRAELAGLGVPSLVLHGEEDRIVPPEAGRYLAETLPAARFRSLPGAGHALPIHHAEWTAARVCTFLEELECSRCAP